MITVLSKKEAERGLLNFFNDGWTHRQNAYIPMFFDKGKKEGNKKAVGIVTYYPEGECAHSRKYTLYAIKHGVYFGGEDLLVWDVLPAKTKEYLLHRYKEAR